MIWVEKIAVQMVRIFLMYANHTCMIHAWARELVVQMYVCSKLHQVQAAAKTVKAKMQDTDGKCRCRWQIHAVGRCLVF
jgi:hypothetical protein